MNRTKRQYSGDTVLPFLAIAAIALILVSVLRAERKGERRQPNPNPPVAKEKLVELTGKLEGAQLSRDIRILWLFGPEDHKGGEHDYIRIKELFVPMLNSISRVTVDEAFQFPTQVQFDNADLLIQYLHLPDLTDEQLTMYQTFIDRGGRVVSLHESCIMRPVDQAEKLAGCIGCSWNGNQQSHWGKFDRTEPLFLKTEHPAFSGLPDSVQLNDESYWNLLTRDNVEVIGAIVPHSEKKRSFQEVLQHPEVRSQAFWTYTSGKGKVFGTTTGHYTYTFHDPVYRLILMRGIAWAIDEDPAPFMPIVYEGITNKQEMVGTTDLMMNYTNRKH